ncbi:zincin, partial [Colletotrichum sublineola]
MRRLKSLLIFCLLNLVCGWKPSNPFRKNKNLCNSATSSSSDSIQSGAKDIGIVAGNIGTGNAFKCGTAEAQALDNAIKHMHEYAGAAYSFLSQPRAERSAAFVAWFGSGNANIHSLTKIRSIFKNIYNLGSKSNHYLRDNEDLGETIGIACHTPHQTGTCNIRPGILAYAISPKGQIFICPVSFIQDKYYLSDASDQTTRSQWAKLRTFVPSGGLTLLHEMTHLQVISGPCHTLDHAYSANACIRLDDEKAINNAQNYELFALEVISNPENAHKQVNWNVDNK